MYYLYGGQFLDTYVGEQVVERTVSVLEGNVGPPSYYLNLLREQFFPWCYLAPFALAYGLKPEGMETRSRKILWALVIVVFGLTTLVQTKLPWYIMPVYPALAIVIALTIKDAVQSRQSIAFGGLVVTSLMTSLSASIVIVESFVGLGVGLVAFCWKVKRDAWQPAAIVMAAFLVAVGLGEILPVYERKQSQVARLAQAAASRVPHDQEPLIVFGVIGGPTASFYSHRPYVHVEDLKQLREITSERPFERIILTNHQLSSLSQFYDAEVIESDSSLVSAVRGKLRQRTVSLYRSMSYGLFCPGTI